ncbi:uncharacterized protein LOC125370423 [Ricinus communis]|uniref:uncharacterized protein LOC125370423 n=1 Tax=Ricinus communis TaxID=3988 RepID=UPI00201A6CBA|nr:uncharacterized protein LOC125370423 [Ricinus communis]
MIKFITSTETTFEQTDSALRNQQASIQNLESQIGRIPKMLAERQPGTFPSTTEPNSKEHVNAIMLRPGKFVPSPSSISNTNADAQVDSSRKVKVTKAKELEKEEAKEVPLREYQPKIPYPARLKQAQVEQQFGKFLDIFKQLHINLPFVEVIFQMPRYAKFLKEILSNKRKFKDSACMTLNEECSAIFQNKLPEKRHDPRSFTIPCIIGNLSVNDALADLGAVINVMSYSLFIKLGLGETKPTRMNMDGENSVPLILGRPFLATSRAMIDVCDGKLKLREVLVEDPLHGTLPRGEKHELSNEEVLEQLEFMLANEPNRNTDEFTVIDRIGVQKLRPSLEELLVLD